MTVELDVAPLKGPAAPAGKITEIRVGASHTFNLGNFNSYRVEALIVLSLNGDSYADVMMYAQDILKDALTKTYQQQRRKEPR